MTYQECNAAIAAADAGPSPLSDLDAILYIEQDASDADTLIEAWQTLIDSGTVYKLQGSYQRGAQAMIDAGYCTPKENCDAHMAAEGCEEAEE